MGTNYFLIKSRCVHTDTSASVRVLICVCRTECTCVCTFYIIARCRVDRCLFALCWFYLYKKLGAAVIFYEQTSLSPCKVSEPESLRRYLHTRDRRHAALNRFTYYQHQSVYDSFSARLTSNAFICIVLWMQNNKEAASTIMKASIRWQRAYLNPSWYM